ncbi:SRPBCC family protein [Streptomyces sp. ISID311]|uniref:SRPBCC family protein n=1 Tax=Streptomyces sp. ISID311 TaxID=2601673 RepID=UPI0011BD330A|nr:SRPBCC family protein [Streptomyces sp. ISID311]TXC99723.1 SRPBCC family protein [Streptomyces sp. ISID311]
MTPTNNQITPLFDVRARTQIAATPAEVYAVVSDLPRSAEWSPECTGGAWVSGRPSTVGAVFLGENLRAEDVVAWAPVVRGTWRTESQVVAAEPGRVFRWAMRDGAGNPQDSVWSYEIEPDGDGCVLVHGLRMGTATEGIRGITAEMDEATKKKFFADWTEKLAADLQATLRRIKAIVEKA